MFVQRNCSCSFTVYTIKELVAFIFCRMLTFVMIEVDCTFGLLDCVRYIENFVKSRFVISRLCPILFTITFTGLRFIVR